MSQYDSMTTEELDDEACRLASRMDSLMLFGATGCCNDPDWHDRKAKSEYKRLEKQLAIVDKLLESRGDYDYTE